MALAIIKLSHCSTSNPFFKKAECSNIGLLIHDMIHDSGSGPGPKKINTTYSTLNIKEWRGKK
jgi:hypothetical protein